MKKYLVVCTVALMMLPCFPLLSQEADEPGPGVEFTIIPRLDLSYECSELALGNSSLYSLIEGNITDNLSFSVANHYTSLYLDEGALCFDSSWESLFDWAYLRYDMGNFAIQLGKDCIFSEGMEGDQYDWDVHPILYSSLWYNFGMYQYGGSFFWHDDSESTTLGLQMMTSPYGDPFTSGLYSFGACWKGEYGNLYNIWSVSFMNTGDGYRPLVSLGQTYSINDNWAVTLDYSNAVGNELLGLAKGHSVYGELCWSPSESLSIAARGGYETLGFAAGAYVNWFPIENLRVHAAAGYNELFDGYTALAGVLYYLSFGI